LTEEKGVIHGYDYDDSGIFWLIAGAGVGRIGVSPKKTRVSV
jgi:hypothetical protein